ncbi:DNA translocase FtsK [Roseibium suaedae]|uniref:DNA translocase FtsK n=1 Tax=Roseibium suaedae TaxID=735517 RepID=UPI0038B47FF9
MRAPVREERRPVETTLQDERDLPQVMDDLQEEPFDEYPSADAIRDESCQSHFYLAPNVRFTRTPDRRARRRDANEQGPEAESFAEDILPAEEFSAAPEPVAAPVLASAPVVATGPVVAPAMPAASAATTVVPAVGTPPAPVSVESLEVSAPVAAESAPSATPLGFLSDHVFFEFMSEDVLPAPVEPVTPAQKIERQVQPAAAIYKEVPPIPRPVTRPSNPPAAQQQRARIELLYRTVECRNPAPLERAQRTVEPVSGSPAQAAPQHPVPMPVHVPAQIQGTIESANSNQRDPAPVRTSISLPASSPRPLGQFGSSFRPNEGQRAPQVRESYEFPSDDLLQWPEEGAGYFMSQEQLEQNAGMLESVLEDFKVRGEIIHVRPGPVVTLYEFEPAPGVKSSRIVNLADDIARSMSAVSARVAVVPGRNVIGIELPNVERETVYFRELIDSSDFRNSSCKLPLCLGKTIGGEPVIAELAKMPHLLVAGTTGSGKSVAINTMILSLLYRLKPEECRLIMIDPKMLELSIYDDIPHLLTPVVTDPKKAVTALKWAVREMEDRYRKMARLGVRNINGFNQRSAVASQKGEPVFVTVQTGFDRDTGEPLYEQVEMDLTPMPYIVIIVDEMADLMMVAGKEIEGTIQRLAQMARAAGIHLITATQRPSVDVITGTIKANFPTRISFQVTSKIDSRTILGEQGAEQLLGMGDMLHMSGGGRINRVHGAFVSDDEVEQVVAHLKTQGRPAYLETVTAEEEPELDEDEDTAVFDKSAMGAEDGDDLYEKAVRIVLRDQRCSTSYIQRRLAIGYNRAASLVERMENEGLVGAPNHVGKREILTASRDHSEE